ncbi:MAG: HD domain-containing phosphohydrolase [Halanaerobiales bacterium]
MTKFADRLRKLRKSKDLRQVDLAEKLGFARTTIANYEQNNRIPGPQTLCQLADFFDVSLDYLLGRTAEKNPSREEGIFASLDSMIKAMADILNFKDPYARHHGERVANLACAIGRELGLPEIKIRALEISGLLHDIGKLKTPYDILNKPDTLDPSEYEIIKKHPQTGFEIIENIDFDYPVARIILQHHERLDGSGYPGGLVGEEIMIEAQILAVADVIEAATSSRPHRDPIPPEQVLNELEAESPEKYDDSITEISRTLMERNNYQFSSNFL